MAVGVTLALVAAPSLGLGVSPWLGLVAVPGVGTFAWAFRSPRTSGRTPVEPVTPLSREEIFGERLTAYWHKGQALLAYDNERMLREAPQWVDDVFDFLRAALVEATQAFLFRDAGPNTVGLPPEVRWNQRLPHQVTLLGNLVSGLSFVAIREDWQP
jgi:hypothetical protein